MTTTASLLLALTGVCAVVDWIAVHRGDRRLEYVFKPATLAALIATTVALETDLGDVRAWFLVALFFSLAGDVFLMLPSDRFVFGLASFLLGHVAYVVGFAQGDLSGIGMGVGVVLVLVSLVVLGRPIVTAVAEADKALVGPVVAYIGVISAMVIAAVGSANAVAIVGAFLFYGSDAHIAWDRFVVDDMRFARVRIMTTYHLGQALIVLSLVAG